jgi:FHA domain
VAAYVEACHAAAKSTGLQADRLGTIDQWRARWLAALRGESGPRTQEWDPEELKEYARRELAKQQHASVLTFPALPTSLVEGDTGAFRAFSDQAISELADIPRDTGVLVVRNEIANGQRFYIEADMTTIGRAEGSQMRLLHTSVSRRHAVIRRQGVRFWIGDVGSINGTYLDQELLTVETRLKSQQELQIGIFRLLFIQGKQQIGRRAAGK